MTRAAGVLLPVTSLPSEYGVGCFDRSAYAFVDFLKGAGQRFWQILPLCPTSYGDSPYQSFSTFAGNPYFISLDALIAAGELTWEECAGEDFGGDPACVDYHRLYRRRLPLLRRAYSRSRVEATADYARFVSEQAWWLEDYALFMALKECLGGGCWYEWPAELRLRREEALAESRRALRHEVGFHRYLQYRFFEQYRALKGYANTRGVRLIGDLPIYVAMDSADVWANPQLFQLGAQGRPEAVAGCPPDGFSAGGQLWGNPLYRWEAHRKDGYRWWISRLGYCSSLYDVTRIDHFRGFDAYYSIPAGAEDAAHGRWEKGPGAELFHLAEQALGPQEMIAEDLGYVTDSVRRLVKDCGFPGMKVIELAFDSRDSGTAEDYLPHSYPQDCVVYTGTHDNEPLAGWLRTISREERQRVREYLCDAYTPDRELHRSLIALAMRSSARWCIVPLQDYLGLDHRARINRPSTVGDNWRWRVRREQLSDDLMQQMRAMTLRYGRLNHQEG